MRNRLRQCYYTLSGVPGLGRMAAWCAPGVKRVAETLAARSSQSLRARLDSLESQFASTRIELSDVLARDPEYAKHCPSFSIIINTCDRRAFLEKALESAGRQNYPAFDIVCVNGPSTDGTDTLLEAWKDRIKVCACPERNLSLSRNLGIAAASGEIVAFMDDDATAPQDWLMELARGYSNPAVAAVGGCVRDHTGITWQSRINVADRYGDVRQYPTVAAALLAEGAPEMWGTQKYFAPLGTNVSFRRADLIGIGGFDENYAYHLDETDVLLRLADAGKSIRYRETAEVTHMFAASGLRQADRTPRSLYHQARSKTYFILRHAAPGCGRKAADKRISAYLAWLDALAQTAFRQGRLERADLERLRQELADGRRDGEDLASREPKLAHFVEETPFRDGTSSCAAGSFPQAATTPLLGEPA